MYMSKNKISRRKKRLFSSYSSGLAIKNARWIGQQNVTVKNSKMRWRLVLETVTVYSFKCGFMDVKSLEVKCKSDSNGDTSDDLVLFYIINDQREKIVNGFSASDMQYDKIHCKFTVSQKKKRGQTQPSSAFQNRNNCS